MKYLKKYNEDIEWDWVEEDLKELSYEELKKYLIVYDTLEECIGISNKLLYLGYDVYDNDNIRYTYDKWIGFIYDKKENEWVQVNNEYKKIKDTLTFDDIKKIKFE